MNVDTVFKLVEDEFVATLKVIIIQCPLRSFIIIYESFSDCFARKCHNETMNTRGCPIKNA